MRALLDEVPIGRSEVLRTTSRGSRLIERGPSTAWAKETGTSIPIGSHADSRRPPNLNGGPASNADAPSRYRVYRYEIEQGHVPDVSVGGESGAPACYSGGDLSGMPDRRILHAAVVNCQSLQLEGEVQFKVPVAAFAKLFLTLPLGSKTDLYVELIGLVRPGGGVSYDVVQLYR